jgi:hypothetical protein
MLSRRVIWGISIYGGSLETKEFGVSHTRVTRRRHERKTDAQVAGTMRGDLCCVDFGVGSRTGQAQTGLP